MVSSGGKEEEEKHRCMACVQVLVVEESGTPVLECVEGKYEPVVEESDTPGVEDTCEPVVEVSGTYKASCKVVVVVESGKLGVGTPYELVEEVMNTCKAS